MEKKNCFSLFTPQYVDMLFISTRTHCARTHASKSIGAIINQCCWPMHETLQNCKLRVVSLAVHCSTLMCTCSCRYPWRCWPPRYITTQKPLPADWLTITNFLATIKYILRTCRSAPVSKRYFTVIARFRIAAQQPSPYFSLQQFTPVLMQPCYWLADR